MSIRSWSSISSLVFALMVKGEIILKTQDVDHNFLCGALGTLFRHGYIASHQSKRITSKYSIVFQGSQAIGTC